MNKILTWCIAFVWVVNGFFSKILNFVPRHEQIVARILGNDYSNLITVLIGCSEILMAVWIITKYKSKINAIMQMIIVLVMNIIEFSLASDLLLWGKWNILFALLFISLVYYNEFIINKPNSD